MSSKPDEPCLESTWTILQAGLDSIMTSGPSGINKKQYMACVTAIHEFCTNDDPAADWSDAKGASAATTSAEPTSRSSYNTVSTSPGCDDDLETPAARLYTGLKTYFTVHLKGLSQAAEDLRDQALLQYYAVAWDRYTQGAAIANNVFAYVNRVHVDRDRERGNWQARSVYTMALCLWRENICEGSAPTAQLPKIITQLLQEERSGQIIDSDAMRKCIDSFVKLGVVPDDGAKPSLDFYHEAFLGPFLKDSRDSHQTWSNEYLACNTVVEYVGAALLRLEEEEMRGHRYLHSSSVAALVGACQEALILPHASVLQNTFVTMLGQDTQHHLSQLYTLLVKVPHALKPVTPALFEHVRSEGLTLMAGTVPETGESSVSDYVHAIVEMHFKNIAMVKSDFRGDPGFLAAVGKACTEVTNANLACHYDPSKSAEILAKYVDGSLKRSGKQCKSDNIDFALSNAMIVFPYLEEKDVFQKFYTKYLGRRLIQGTSVSEDAEAQMLLQLKLACGSDYTAGLQRMLQDMAISQELNTAFQEHLLVDNLEQKAVDFSVAVLSHQWPLSAPVGNFAPPQEINKLEERFKLFYMNRYSGRKLIWLYNHSRCEIRMMYTNPKRVLQVSAFQAAILVQFNDTTAPLSLEHLRAATQLQSEQVLPMLDLLVKQNILLQKDGSAYEINLAFKSAKMRLNINLPSKAQTAIESKEVLEQVIQGRRIEIQAVIVRIMKARKTLTMTELVNEAIQQLTKRFPPRVCDVKLQIDWLVENEYLARGETRGVLIYLA